MKTEDRSVWAAPYPSNPEPTIEPMTDEKIERLIGRLKEAGEIAEAQRQEKRQMDDAEVKRLVAELDELRKLIPKEEIDLEEVRREAEAEYKSIPMYDWGARKNSNEHDMSMKYGLKIVNELRRGKWDAEHIPKSLIADMHRIHEGKSPPQGRPVTPGTRLASTGI